MQKPKRKSARSPSPPRVAEKLANLIHARQTIPYHENVPEKEFPYITCSVYGAPETNELFVKLTNGTVSFVEAVKSDLYYPVMADRIFGMDVQDHHTAFRLAEQMWEKHKAALVIDPPPQKPPP